MKAIIFSAGYGTRLQPWTNNKPKALVEYKNIPLLQHVILKLKKHNFNDIIINIHHFANQIEEFIKQNNSFGINITFSDELDLLLDTGGGLKKTAHFFNDNKAFLAYNVDIISDIDLNKFYDYHINNKVLVTLAVQNRKTSRQLLFDAEKNLCQWKNIITGEIKQARRAIGNLEPYAFSGLHIINPDIFEKIKEDGVFSIIDLYLRLSKNENIIYYNHNNSSWKDLGRKENFNS